MTAIAFEAADAAPLSDEARAAALWTFIQLRTPRFASSDALDVVRELAAKPGDDVKSLSRRLRKALVGKGIVLKHVHSLNAAARLLGHESWHAGGSQAALKPLKLLCHFPGFDRSLATWEEAVKFFGDYCEGEISAGGTCLFHFHFTATSVSMDLPFTEAQDNSGKSVPLMQVRWAKEDQKQLAAAAIAVESLRRRFEEPGRAIVDGLAATQFCLHNPHPESVFEDPINSELVVVDMTPGPSYLEEISRGDENKCWADLEEVFNRDAVYVAEGSHWVIKGTQLGWFLSTLRSASPAPHILTRPLTPTETSRLLRRYRNAVRADRIFLNEDRVKRLDVLNRDALGIDVNWELVSAEISRTRLNESKFQDIFDGSPVLASRISTEQFARLVAFLDGPGPNELIRKPTRSELVRLDDDGILRTLVSRVQDVVYEVPRRLPESQVKAVDQAINMFLTALRVEMETSDGRMIEGIPRGGPYLIHANQGKELLDELKELGLVAYAGLTTNVRKLRADQSGNAAPMPLRFERVLLLDLEFAAHAETVNTEATSGQSSTRDKEGAK